jgi:hypothetical protein
MFHVPKKQSKWSQMWKQCSFLLRFQGRHAFRVCTQGQTVNQNYYLEVLKRLRNGLRSRQVNSSFSMTKHLPAQRWVCSDFWPKIAWNPCLT